MLLDGVTTATVSHNVFGYSYNNVLQISNSKSVNVTDNYSLDASWDMEDADAQPAGYDTVTFSGNTFACDSTGAGYLVEEPTQSSYYGGYCVWKVLGCSGGNCTTNEYSGVNIINNIITGPGASLTLWSAGGETQSGNTFANGGVLTSR